MFKEFNQFSFNVIDVTLKGESDILINTKGITISRGVIEEMGFPSHVRMMIDNENKVFAIQACKQTDENAYRFSKPKGEQKKPVYCHIIAIRNIIRDLMADSWSEKDSYRIKGIYYKDAKAMVFNLKAATRQEPYSAPQKD